MARPNKNDEKKDLLITTAEQVFIKFGYGKTTLEDIANAAGMNKASLYHYFKNKEALFLAVLLQVAKNGFTTLLEKCETINNLEKKVLFFFEQRIDLYLRLVKLNGLTKEALLQLHGQFDAAYAAEREKEIEFIQKAIAQSKPNMAANKMKALVLEMFDVVDAIKHDGVFLKDLLQDAPAQLPAISKRIHSVIQIYLNTILK